MHGHRQHRDEMVVLYQLQYARIDKMRVKDSSGDVRFSLGTHDVTLVCERRPAGLNPLFFVVRCDDARTA